jgi:seryl-tRNA synthetase
MLDIKFIRENKDLIKEGARKKHLEFDVDALVALDDKRKALVTSVEAKKAQQNEVSAKMPVASPEERQSLISLMQAVKAELNAEEENLKEIMSEWQKLMVAVPNIPDISVPEGSTDEENAEIRTWGEIPQLDFTPRTHIELMETLGMADFERGTKVSGFRGYFLKGDGALLNFALWQFVTDHFVKKNFTPMIVPSLVRRETLIGSGYLPQGEEDLYKTQDNDYLAGTGEVATMAYYSGEVIDKAALPMKMLAFSPCFRREAGSHGKDTKGLMRVHEFFKLEQVVLCEADHQQSVDLHEEITKNAEEIMQLLSIPYHVVANCGGDLGLGQVKKYDIEAWVPSEGKYRETHSASYFHDFQSRRLNIRYRDDEGKLRFVHSLNSTALPTPRPLIALIENNQTADGSIIIPEALRPYMGGREIISAVK